MCPERRAIAATFSSNEVELPHVVDAGLVKAVLLRAPLGGVAVRKDRERPELVSPPHPSVKASSTSSSYTAPVGSKPRRS